MAYTSGTASNYKDLLAVMASFAAANGWVILEQSETKVYLKGTGLAGLDEIYCGVETYEDPPNNKYNWKMVGSWGWRAGRLLEWQPRSSCYQGSTTWQTQVYLWNAAIPYWMVCTPRRIMMFAKVGSTYQCCHLGFLNVTATDVQYPYPLFIAGCGVSNTYTYASTNISAFWNTTLSYHGQLCFPGGTWSNDSGGTETYSNHQYDILTYQENKADIILTALDGSYYLEPFYLIPSGQWGILGTIDGLCRVSGYNNTAENIITVDGVNWMVFPDVYRAGYINFAAMRLT